MWVNGTLINFGVKWFFLHVLNFNGNSMKCGMWCTTGTIYVLHNVYPHFFLLFFSKIKLLYFFFFVRLIWWFLFCDEMGRGSIPFNKLCCSFFFDHLHLSVLVHIPMSSQVCQLVQNGDKFSIKPNRFPLTIQVNSIKMGSNINENTTILLQNEPKCMRLEFWRN